jgi:hypothetical protein
VDALAGCCGCHPFGAVAASQVELMLQCSWMFPVRALGSAQCLMAFNHGSKVLRDVDVHII